jgi:hypothetical protein
LKKKRQKNFCPVGALARLPPQPAISKSFLLLFFKKEALRRRFTAREDIGEARGVA